MNDSIKYDNKWYKIRIIDHKEFGRVNFGSTHLSNKIISESGEPISKEAEKVDEQIYFYLSPSLFSLSDEELKSRFF